MQIPAQLNELAVALAAAQAEIENPVFDSINPHFKSKYSSLAAVRDAVVPALAKHGISLMQWPRIYIADTGNATRAGVHTILLHSSGQSISDTLLMPLDRDTAHSIGSAITYARRFSLQSIAGVSGDDDDDGNSAVGANVRGSKLPAGQQEKGEIDADTSRQALQNFSDGEVVLRLKSCANLRDLTREFNALPVDQRRPGSEAFKAFTAQREQFKAPAGEPK